MHAYKEPPVLYMTKKKKVNIELKFVEPPDTLKQ